MPASFLQDLFQAYYDARRNKRNTHSQLAFELDYESNLLQLYKELKSGVYSIGPSTCFLICDTVPREIFAADFRDRIVQHLIYKYIYDICDKQFIHDSYSCRVGKGTHYGVKRVEHFIRSCSANYTQDCYILKLDIKGFFMNIDKERLTYDLRHLTASKRDKIQCSLGFDRLWKILVQIINHNPLDNYCFQGSRELYDILPVDKSLFSCVSGVGLPIGNLTSQLFANVYLHRFDVWMKKTMGCKYYGRYVDDFVVVHRDKQFLKNLIQQIRTFLQTELGLTLHPKKIYLQHHTKGVKFLGAYIKPRRTYINRRTMGRGMHAFHYVSKNTFVAPSSAKQKVHIDRNILRDNLATINSYLGMMKHWRNYRKRKELCEIVSKHYIAENDMTKCLIIK